MKQNGPMKAAGRLARENIRKARDKQRGHSRPHAGFNDRWDQMDKAQQQAQPAMIRDVWFVSPEPNTFAHFAVFPKEALIYLTHQMEHSKRNIEKAELEEPEVTEEMIEAGAKIIWEFAQSYEAGNVVLADFAAEEVYIAMFRVYVEKRKAVLRGEKSSP